MSTKKQLPGFLRRSLRRDNYDEGDEDEVEEEEEQDEGVKEEEEGTAQNGAAFASASLKTDASTIALTKTTRTIEPTQTQSSRTSQEQSLKQQQRQAKEEQDANDQQQHRLEQEEETRRRKLHAPSCKLSDSWQEIPDYPVVEPVLTLTTTTTTVATSPVGQAICRGDDQDDEAGGYDAQQQQQEQQQQPRAVVSWRDAQFQKCLLEADIINLQELRKLGWNGIPTHIRALAWKVLLGYIPTNEQRRASTLQRKRSEYKDVAMAQHYYIDDDSRTLQEQETLRQVLVDVPRTAPEIPLFRNDRIKRVLTRLLYIWAMRHPASSYVQGINDLATPLIIVFLADYFEGQDVLDGHVMNHLGEEKLEELEADVYWCLTNLLAGIQDHYTNDQPGVQRMVKRLEDVVQRIDTNLCQHLRNEGVQFLQFSFKWMNCLLLREFHLRCIPRLWDTYLCEKNGFEDFHVYVCAAFLCQFSSQLQEMSFDELFGFFQQIPTTSWTELEVEMLLSQAYVLFTLFGGSDAHLANSAATSASTPPR